jgi:A/G-specific adenine glycosylase
MAERPRDIDTERDQLPDGNWRRRFRHRLTRWYQRHARPLPWRQTRDPYRIWVSEVMLQQTQVVTVQSYFEEFLQRFPDIATLAAASEERVLRAWEGLGYYRRARQLHAAAREIMTRHGGEFPNDIQAAQDLPGVGRYTAGAILSIALDQRQPILEANTIRVFSRLLGYRGPAARGPGQRLLWAFARQILPRRQPGLFNQALMELGSLVCAPQPRCLACPVARLCAARAAGLQDQLPVKPPKPEYQQVREAAVIVRRQGTVLLRRCGVGERWEGLWDFPRFPWGEAGTTTVLAESVQRLTGVTIVPGPLLMTIKHGVTRFRITLSCHLAEYRSGQLKHCDAMTWADHAQLDELPLSTTGRRIARKLTGV